MNLKVNKEVVFKDLGFVDYQKAWDFQEDLFKEIIDIKVGNRNLAEEAQLLTPNYLLFCHHPHVYTIGKSGKEDNLLVTEEDLTALNASYYKINRGGDITYHGPGQIVGYPIFDLDNFFTDIHKYLRLLEEAVINTLREFGIEGGRIAGLTGVWIDSEKTNPRKICAMGVRSSRWVTMHGFALNVNTDLSYFGNIVPCGIGDKQVTSMQVELGNEVNIKEVQNSLLKNLSSLFEFNLKH